MSSSFAKKHLESLGWESGQGLGANKQGISDAIKPDLKRDQAGLGHIAEEFGFAWWDHCFTKAAKKIEVEHCEKSGDVKVRAEKTTIETKLSSKRAPTSLLYGSFVAAKKDGEDDADDGTEDHSTLSKLTDEEVFRRCGGRTAHKGARHNISQVAKLKRSKEDKLIKSLEAGDAKETNGMEKGSGKKSKSKIEGELEPKSKKRKRLQGAEETSVEKPTKKSKSKTTETAANESAKESKKSKSRKSKRAKEEPARKSKAEEQETAPEASGKKSKKMGKSTEKPAKGSKKSKNSKSEGKTAEKGGKSKEKKSKKSE